MEMKSRQMNEFLTDFVEEAITLTKHGVQINDQIYQFKINSFVCDVPAKAFLLSLHLRRAIPAIIPARNVRQKAYICLMIG